MKEEIKSNTLNAKGGDVIHPAHVIVDIWAMEWTSRDGMTTVYTKLARKGGGRTEGKIRIPNEWIDNQYEASIPLDTDYPKGSKWKSRDNKIKRRIFGYIPLRKHFGFTY